MRLIPIFLALMATTTPVFAQSCGDHISQAIMQYWNVGTLSRDVLETEVELRFDLDANNLVLPNTIRIVGVRSEAGIAGPHVETAFHNARRAIMRAGQVGPLPMPRSGEFGGNGEILSTTVRFPPC